MASEPSDTEIRAMYATALQQIATLTAENEALKACVPMADREVRPPLDLSCGNMRFDSARHALSKGDPS